MFLRAWDAFSLLKGIFNISPPTFPLALCDQGQSAALFPESSIAPLSKLSLLVFPSPSSKKYSYLVL